jgi:DNA-nicking Smr family endonuclease
MGDDEDRQAFLESMRDVRRMATAPEPSAPPPPAPQARQRLRDEREVLRESLAFSPAALDVESGDELLFRRPHVPPETLRALRRGQYAVAAEIDLHGLVEREAREALREFLAEAVFRGDRCVRVIHGKGLRSGPRGPVLKRAVNHWLRRTEPVLAFASARGTDGGTGAVYVLLQR